MQTFRAADGRRVRRYETEEQKAERELMDMISIIFPALTVLIFALAAGVI